MNLNLKQSKSYNLVKILSRMKTQGSYINIDIILVPLRLIMWHCLHPKIKYQTKNIFSNLCLESSFIQSTEIVLESFRLHVLVIIEFTTLQREFWKKILFSSFQDYTIYLRDSIHPWLTRVRGVRFLLFEVICVLVNN